MESGHNHATYDRVLSVEIRHDSLNYAPSCKIGGTVALLVDPIKGKGHQELGNLLLKQKMYRMREKGTLWNARLDSLLKGTRLGSSVLLCRNRRMLRYSACHRCGGLSRSNASRDSRSTLPSMLAFGSRA